PEFLGHFHEGWEESILHLIVEVDSLRANASLATVPEPRPDSTSQSPGQVCVVPHDKRRLSTQLKDELGHMTGCSFHYFLARLSASRHRDQRSDLVGNQLVAYQFSTPRHHVQNTLRQPCFLRKPNQLDSTQRRIARRLRDNRVSCHECRSYLPGGHRGWKVPRSNRRNHTKGQFEYHYRLSRVVAWENVSLYSPSVFGVVFEILRRSFYL